MRRKWTELQAPEYNMLKRFLIEISPFYIRAEHSRRVGSGVEPPADMSEEYAKAVRNSSRLKIDFVGWRSEVECDIIEVKDRALPGTIGQLQLYKRLLERETKAKINLVIVCATAHPDVKEYAEQENIRIYEMG